MKTKTLYLHPLLYPVKYRGTPIFVFSTAGLSRCLPRLNPAFNGGASSRSVKSHLPSNARYVTDRLGFTSWEEVGGL
jgi:hypothetical protein